MASKRQQPTWIAPEGSDQHQLKLYNSLTRYKYFPFRREQLQDFQEHYYNPQELEQDLVWSASIIRQGDFS